MVDAIILNQNEICNIFTEWMNRYNTNPDQFAKEYGEAGDYGESASRYFIKLCHELRGEEQSVAPTPTP